MSPEAWPILQITLPIILTIVGGGWRVLRKLDRLTDSVDDLKEGHTDNSRRITTLEGRLADHVLDVLSHHRGSRR